MKINIFLNCEWSSRKIWLQICDRIICDYLELWKEKSQKSDLISGLCWKIFFYAAKKQYMVIFSNDSAQSALEKSTGIGRRWILKVFAAWGTIMVKWGSPMWQRENNSNNLSSQRH